ncbi:MAG: peptide/nickel transport system substrate-binding protein [Thermomicrobiales bacterium]|jgi:peptide/nickel transport system substrate-binding protein|nr:peptide/nickel transport system substrate-binding protein [Thermomicrobiales bacterium]MEA2593617.1 peptide/nickel transport system substrate-binding protein [Thermomicrobiales bacterium]
MGTEGRHTRISRRQIIRAGAGAGAAGILSSRGLAAAPAATVGPRTRALRQDTGTPKTGGNLIAAGTGDIKFDPYFNVVPARFVYSQFFSSLFDYRGEDPLAPHPQLAETWQEEEKAITVTLRKGVKFHNGREMVAQDIVDNIARAKDESLGHYLFSIFDPSVEGSEVVDNYTVKIHYKKVHPVKLDDLAALFIIPKEAMENIGSTPVGSGPFKYESYMPGDSMVATRFEDYWEENLPYLDQFTVKIIADPQARLANLQSGDVDAVDSLAASDVARLKEGGEIQITNLPVGGTWYANVLNCAKPPYDNKLVRQAMNFSIDRDKINQLAYYGLAPVTQSRYLPDQFWYDEKASTFYTFDLDKAKALLAEAGLPEGFETTIVVSETVLPGSKAMAQVWQQDLEKIGVKMAIEEREQGPFYDEYFAGNYDVQAYGLGDSRLDPATYLVSGSPYRPENNKANIQGQPFFEEYVRLIGEGANSIDPAVRKPIYDRIQQIITEEGWVITTAFWLSFAGFTNRVQGYRSTIGAGHYFGDVWLAE